MTPSDLSSYPPVVPPRPGRRRVLKYLDSGLGIRASPRPKVGRFRLYEWNPSRTRLVCRACRVRIKPENQMRHLATEMARHGSQEALEARLALRAAQRRGDRHLRGKRYVYALATSRDWRDRERLDPRKVQEGRQG